MKDNIPKVGLGVIIINDKGKVLIGKRVGAHAQKYSIPGGHLDLLARHQLDARLRILDHGCQIVLE